MYVGIAKEGYYYHCPKVITSTGLQWNKKQKTIIIIILSQKLYKRSVF